MITFNTKTEFDRRLAIIKAEFHYVTEDSIFKWDNINSFVMLNVKKNWTSTTGSNSNFQMSSTDLKDFFPILQISDAFPHWRLKVEGLISNSVYTKFATPPNASPWIEGVISYRHKIQSGSYPYLQLTLEDELRQIKNSLNEDDQVFFLKENNSAKYFLFATTNHLFTEQTFIATDPTKSAVDKTQFDLSTLHQNQATNVHEKEPKNIILYGPPGTGKTHNSITHAVSIIRELDYKELDASQKSNPTIREAIKKDFDKLVEEGQIDFVTFHQSYSYEEFVEGIKPTANSEGVIEYNIEDGIFKKLCIRAQQSSTYDFDDIFEEFIDELKVGNISLKTSVRKKDFTVTLNEKGDVYAVTGNGRMIGISEKAVYEYFTKGILSPWHEGSYVRSIVDYLRVKYASKIISVDNADKEYVLIIDEINRGNISKIFGELITLIEKSKRLGASEALKARLTYSGSIDGELFGVPKNIHIIGTMNSADKSIALIDTALRRRFSFLEYSSDESLLSNDVDGIDLQKLVSKMNQRIEVLLDKDHYLGHAYFIDVTTKEELCFVFKNKVIPLLEEYFYGDFEKVQLVLGDNKEYRKSVEEKLVIPKIVESNNSLFGTELDGFDDKTLFTINPNLLNDNFSAIDASVFTSIYTKSEDAN